MSYLNSVRMREKTRETEVKTGSVENPLGRRGAAFIVRTPAWPQRAAQVSERSPRH